MVFANLTNAPGYISSLAFSRAASSFPWKFWRSDVTAAAPVSPIHQAEQQPLTFRHPIPSAESDILPDAIDRCEARFNTVVIDATNPQALSLSFSQSKQQALRLRDLNEHFINDMEIRSASHFRRLEDLMGAIDMVQAKLNGSASGQNLAEGNRWCFWRSREAQRRVVLASYVTWYAAILEDMVATRDKEHRELHDIYALSQPDHMYGFCKVEETLRDHKGRDKDLHDASRIICSSEVRTNARWNKVSTVIGKFRISLGRAKENAKGQFDNPGPVQQSYQSLSGSVKGILRELQIFANL